jgi:CheY-like chemotaxis protein
VLGGVLGLSAWTGNLHLFTVYWVTAAAVYWASWRLPRVAPFTTVAVALLDMPMVFLLQWATFPTSPSVSGVAGFTLGVYVLLLILAALSLENWYVWVTAALRLLEKREQFDLILCDLMMPAMTGMELRDELSRLDSSQAARMSFLTGGAFTPRARAFLAEVPNPRLEKPFDPQGLRSFVRALV